MTEAGEVSGDDERAHEGVLRILPPEAGTARIVLVRHGEAECNRNGIVGGRTGCTGLTDLGRAPSFYDCLVEVSRG